MCKLYFLKLQTLNLIWWSWHKSMKSWAPKKLCLRSDKYHMNHHQSACKRSALHHFHLFTPHIHETRPSQFSSHICTHGLITILNEYMRQAAAHTKIRRARKTNNKSLIAKKKDIFAPHWNICFMRLSVEPIQN